jgi:Cu/Ag efflux protein CusF
MKNLVVLAMAVIFALSVPGLTLAQEKVKDEGIRRFPNGKSTEASKPVEAQGEKGITAKPFTWRMGGMITAVDPQAKTISIHQETIYHDRVLKLEVSQKVDKELSGIKTGDLVNVWVKGKVVTALNKVA